MATPPGPKGPNQFDVARKRASQQEKALSQERSDAIKRRQAALGNLNSGAAMKQQNIAADQSARRLRSANEQINAAEQAENRRIREVQEGRDFARSEREASQQFAGKQAALQRALQARGLSLQEELGRGQLELSRDQFGLQKKQFNTLYDPETGLAFREFGLKESAHNALYDPETGLAFRDADRADRKIDLAEGMQKFQIGTFNPKTGQFEGGYQQQEFAQNKLVTGFNAMLSAINSGLPSGDIKGLVDVIAPPDTDKDLNDAMMKIVQGIADRRGGNKASDPASRPVTTTTQRDPRNPSYTHKYNRKGGI